MKNKLSLKFTVFILLFSLNIQSQTVFNVSGNTVTLNTHRNGWKMDSILIVPVRGHAISNTATQLLGRIQVNSTSLVPEYNNGSGWNKFVTENSGYVYSKSQSDALFKPISYVPTKADVGLLNADNTSDLNKPISNATQTALNGKLNAEVDGSITNELQSLSISGNTLTISSGNSISIPSNAYTAGTGISIASNVVSNTLPDQTVIVTSNGSNTVTGTYPSFNVNVTAPTVSAATRTLNSNFTISTNKTADVFYSVTCTATNPLLAGSSSAMAYLEYSTNAGITWNLVSQNGNTNSVGLAVTVQLTNSQTGVLSGSIPLNSLVRIRTAVTGTATVTYVTGQEKTY